MKKLLTLLLSVVFIFSFAACGDNESEKREGRISISVYAAGYGINWVEEAIRSYQEDNPDVKFYVDGNPLAFENIKTRLENGNCLDDIVIIDSSYYDQFVSQGFLEDLTPMYDSVIPGSDKTVRDVVATQLINAKTVDGKIYGVPWQQNNGSGLIYNVEMFERYGWTLPETMDEFYNLCDDIYEDTNGRVVPLTFGGADGYGYLAYNFSQWLCEYYGYDAMMEFLKLESPDAYSVQSAGRTKVYETIAKIVLGRTDNGHPISLEGSSGAEAATAQTNFVNGTTAMLVCGQWFPTEMKPYTELVQFEAGYLPMPHINADKKSGDGTIDTSDVRFSTDGNLLGIPTTAQHKEEAMDFLRHMFTTKSYTSFVAANNGLIRPVEGLEADDADFNAFTKSAYDYFTLGGNAKTVYQVTPDGVIEKGTLAIFMAHRGAFFSRIASCATYEAALNVAQGCFASEMTSVRERWDSSKNQWI